MNRTGRGRAVHGVRLETTGRGQLETGTHPAHLPASRRGYAQFLVGVGALCVFLLTLLIAGRVVVDEPGRTERLSDGRVVSIGKSWPGRFDSCVTDVGQRVLPNCYREPVDRDSTIKQPMSVMSALAYS